MSDRLDLVLVNPGGRRAIYQKLADHELIAVEPPVWVGLIATYMRNRGLSVKIVDSEALDWDAEQTADEIARLDPLLAAVIVFGSQPSASTQKMPSAGAIVTAIRERAPNVKSLLGGVHVSALPKRTLEEEDVDFVCEGEGPVTIEKLILALKSATPDRVGHVPGLWYRRDGEIKNSMPAPLIHDLDKDLPGVAWDLLPMERYRAHNWHCFDRIHERQPYAVLYTSLGCPYKCSFCCINAPFGKPSIRFRSPESQIQEIALLVEKYKVRNIKILDEMFVLNERHVIGICDLIIERGYDLNIWAYARVDTVKDKFLEKLKRAGFNWLALGIESGSEHVRDGAEKSLTQDDIADTVKQIQDAGINVIGNYIFGLPDDDRRTMQETLDLALRLNCEFGNFYSAMAYPGSKLYTWAQDEGLRLPEQWGGYSQHAFETLPLPTKHISGEEVLRFRDHAFHTYFSSPAYLSMVERKFGRDTVEHIEKMSQHRLERKFVPA